MKNTSITIILLVALLCSCNTIDTANMRSSLSIDIELTKADSCKGLMPFACIMNVEQSLTINNMDTIVLNIVYPKSLPVAEMGIRNIHVNCAGKELPYTFANDSLVFETISGCNGYSLVYEVYASSFLSNGLGGENCFIGDFYLYNTSSWYFTCPDMQLVDSKITSSDSLVILSSGIHTDNTEFRRHIKPSTKLDIIALHKRFYNRYVLHQDICNCDVYLRNFHTDKLKIDTIINSHDRYNSDYIHIGEYISDDILETKVELVGKYLRLAASAFNAFPDTLNIVECLWGNEKYSGGQAISPNIILADTAFFSANNGALLHELIHTCDKLDYHRLCKDSSLFFFSESMIEYMTRYLMKTEANINYSAWGAEDNYLKHNDLKPIFKIHDNNRTTQYTIYAYVPYIIDQFAQKIGEEKFVELYKEFHQICIEQQELSFDGFICHLRKSNISQQHLDEFIASLDTVF